MCVTKNILTLSILTKLIKRDINANVRFAQSSNESLDFVSQLYRPSGFSHGKEKNTLIKVNLFAV